MESVEVLPTQEELEVPDDENFKFKSAMRNKGKTVQLVIKFDMKNEDMAEVFVKSYGEFVTELISSCFAKSILDAAHGSKDVPMYS